MAKLTVIYTKCGGPYTVHQLSKLFIPISHRGTSIAELFVAHSEEGVIHKIVSAYTRSQVVSVTYPDNVTAYKAILQYLVALKAHDNVHGLIAIGRDAVIHQGFKDIVIKEWSTGRE